MHPSLSRQSECRSLSKTLNCRKLNLDSQVLGDSRTVLAEDAAFAPWQESSWSQRATQGLDAQGQDWFDQPGAFVGGGYVG